MGNGKPLTLFATVEEHHEALEVDLLDRGIDLLDLWRGKLSWRRLAVFIRRFQTDRTSALSGSIRDVAAAELYADTPDTPEMTRKQMLQAVLRSELSPEAYLLIEQIDLFVQKQWNNADPETREERPAPHWRPGDVPTDVDRRQLPAWDSEEVREYLEFMYAQPSR